MVSSDAFSEEKLRTMRAFGATVEIIASEDRKITHELIQAMIDRAGELAKKPNTFEKLCFNYCGLQKILYNTCDYTAWEPELLLI